MILVVLAVMAWGLNWITPGIFGSVVAGLFAGVIIGQITERYTSDEYGPTQGIAEQTKMGAATTIIDGLAVGMFSAGWSVITIVIGIICAYGFAGGFSNPSMGLFHILYSRNLGSSPTLAMI